MANISNSFLPGNHDWQDLSTLRAPAPEETLSESTEYGYGAGRLEVDSYTPSSKQRGSVYQSTLEEELISLFSKLQISSVREAGPSPVLVKADVPSSAMRGALSEKDQVLKTVMGLLNKLTPQKFDVLKDQLTNLGINSAEILLGVTSLIFDRAVTEPIFCPMYAELCRQLSCALPQFSSEEPDGKPIAFRRILLNTCQATFEGKDILQAEIQEMTGPDQEAQRCHKERMAKLRSLGNIRLIGELFKQRMVPEKIIHHCIQHLLGQDLKVPQTEENVKALCLLFNIVGKQLEGNSDSGRLIDYYLAQMEQLSNNQHLPSQTRFMVHHVLGLHSAKQKLGLRRGTTNMGNRRSVMRNKGGRNSFGIGRPGALMPGLPIRRSMPGMPGMPILRSMPGMPGMPILRSMPAMNSEGLKGLPRNARLLPQGNGGLLYGKPRALPTGKTVKSSSDYSQSYDHMDCD